LLDTLWLDARCIDALNEGLQTFKDDLIKNSCFTAMSPVVTFNLDVNVVQDFVTAEDFEPPTLTAQGLTHRRSDS